MSGLRSLPSGSGFTIVEMLIVSVMTMAAMGGIFAVISPARAALQAQGEVADMHQRLRAAIDMLSTDLRAADAVRPYHVGGSRDDGVAGVYYRPDVISVLDVPSSALSSDSASTRTYYLKSDPASNAFELMQFDGLLTDLPVVDHVAQLVFEYVGTAEPPDSALVALDPAILVDGPWSDDGSHGRFDVDLLRVREVVVRLRLESTDASMRGGAAALFAHPGRSTAPERFVPDNEIELHVAPRRMVPPLSSR